MPTTTPTTDATLPGFKETQNRDARFRKECKDFADLCAKARSAGRDPGKLTNGLLHGLVFEARNAAGSVGRESMDALARAGKVRKGLYNEDVRPVVASLLAFAAKGGAMTEEEFAARGAECFAAVCGRADAVFRRLVAVAFPAQACAVFADGGRELRFARGEFPFRQFAALRREGEEGFDGGADVPVPEVLADPPAARERVEGLRAGRAGVVARLEDEGVEESVGELLRVAAGRAGGGVDSREGVAGLLEFRVGPVERPAVGEGGVVFRFGGVGLVRSDHVCVGSLCFRFRE